MVLSLVIGLAESSTHLVCDHLDGKVIDSFGVWTIVMVCKPEWWLQVVLLGVDYGCLDGRKVGSLGYSLGAGLHGSIVPVYSKFSL